MWWSWRPFQSARSAEHIERNREKSVVSKVIFVLQDDALSHEPKRKEQAKRKKRGEKNNNEGSEKGHQKRKTRVFTQTSGMGLLLGENKHNEHNASRERAQYSHSAKAWSKHTTWSVKHTNKHKHGKSEAVISHAEPNAHARRGCKVNGNGWQ